MNKKDLNAYINNKPQYCSLMPGYNQNRPIGIYPGKRFPIY